MTKEVDNGSTELEAKAEADVAAKAGETASSADADASGLSDGDGKSDRAAPVSAQVRSYLLGYNEEKMRELIADVDYMNMGRVGSPFPDDFVERVLDHPAVQGEKSLSAARSLILSLRVDELGDKSDHPRGR